MKIVQVGSIEKREDDRIVFTNPLDRSDNLDFPLSELGDLYEEQLKKPYSLEEKWPRFNNFPKMHYFFRGRVLAANNEEQLSGKELELLIKHFVLKQEKTFDKVIREIEAFERIKEVEVAKRERIPDSVKIFVWQRDEGKCVKCGSKEKLEFDHIIPVVTGGSSTERNIQLLCENCNRSKGKSL